jgi:hypothetical protein
MITDVLDLGTSDPPVGMETIHLAARDPLAEQPPIVISGLPQDAGTLRR